MFAFFKASLIFTAVKLFHQYEKEQDKKLCIHDISSCEMFTFWDVLHETKQKNVKAYSCEYAVQTVECEKVLSIKLVTH